MIENAQIKSTKLGYEHDIFTCELWIESSTWGQGFGGYNLNGPWFCVKYITGLLSTLDIEAWEDLAGTLIRIDRRDGQIKRIGHIIKDQWFDPETIGK